MSGSARAGTKTGVAVGAGISGDDEPPDEPLGAVVAVGSAVGVSVTIGSESVLVAGAGVSEGERVDVGTGVGINDFTVGAVVADSVGSACGDGSTEIVGLNSGSPFWHVTRSRASPPTPI